MRSQAFAFLRGIIPTSPTTIFVVVLLGLLPAFVLIAYQIPSKSIRPGPGGCRKIGVRMHSNLKDQYSKKYGKRVEPRQDSYAGSTWKVKALFIFPVKSCSPVELNRGEIIGTGMKYDRQYLFAHLGETKPDDGSSPEPQWQFITQRAFPKLATVNIDVWAPDSGLRSYNPESEFARAGGCLNVSFPFYPPVTGFLAPVKAMWRIIMSFLTEPPHLSFRVPFQPDPEQIKRFGLKTHNVKVWKDCPEAHDMSNFVRESTLNALQKYLGVKKPLGLFRIRQDSERQVFRNAPRKDQLGYQAIHGFTDAYPLHFNNLASIHDVASHLPKGFGKLGALRFRSNIYVTGPGAFEEDTWKRIRIGKHEYVVTNRTARCTLPCVDPKTGAVEPYKKDGDKNTLWNDPLKTLKEFRLVDAGAGENPVLGMQMIPAVPDVCIIKVGDAIEVLETGEHYFLKS